MILEHMIRVEGVCVCTSEFSRIRETRGRLNHRKPKKARSTKPQARRIRMQTDTETS